MGSIDVYKVPMEHLQEVVRSAVKFLLLVTYGNQVPLKKQQEVLRDYRPVGLGIMGFAKLLISKHIRYGSDESLQFADKLLEEFVYDSYTASEDLADEFGAFPKYEQSKHAKPDFRPWSTNNKRLNRMVSDRHVVGKKLASIQVNTIAPTGTISMLADTSSGLEPEFMLSYTKTITHRDDSKEELTYTLPEVEEFLGEIGEDESISAYVREHGKLPEFASEEAKRVLVTSHDVTPEQHLAMLNKFAEYTDASVSKTINMPKSATVKDIYNVYKTALVTDGIKGITIYRDGSLETQVLKSVEEKIERPSQLIILDKKKKILPKKVRTIVNSYTTRFKAAKGTVVVTLSVDEFNDPVEVFVYNGGEKAEIIGRLLSIGMRSGISLDEYMEQLKKCNGEFTTKIAEEIEKLVNYVQGKEEDNTAIMQAGQSKGLDFDKMTLVKGFYYVDDKGNKYCAHCHAKNTISYEDGCISCKACGASACTVS